MNMPMKKTSIWDFKPVDLLTHKPLVLLALSFVLICASYNVCDAQLVATANAGGTITLTGWSGSMAIFRDTSPLLGRAVADMNDPLTDPWVTSTAPWTDGDDENHPTGDGAQYYYAIDINGNGTFDQGETATAIADRTAPRIENIAAMPSPFSPFPRDGYEDTTMIFFTLTEATYVTLEIYDTLPSPSLVKTLLDGSELLHPGDNFVLWDGTDNADVIVFPGRYLYKFTAADNEDAVGNTLIQDISGDIIVVDVFFELTDISVTPTPFSPDGDKIRDCTYISYKITSNADYVAGNVFAVDGGHQQIVARIYAECLYYYWDSEAEKWIPRHLADGIAAGLSTQRYYIRPIDASLPPPVGDPPFDIRGGYPGDPGADPPDFVVDTIAEYWTVYGASYPNWEPVSYTLSWCGAGATNATTYIISLEAMKSGGEKTMAKTHEIIIENPAIIPNDKTPPVVTLTYPRAGSVHNVQLSYVQAFLSDGQGTGVNLANCTIALLGPAGQNIPGWQSNDASSSLTWHLQNDLSETGSDDGTYTIVVSAIDYARNRIDNLRFQFEYNMRSNDEFPPEVDGMPLAIAENTTTSWSFSANTLIEPSAPDEGVARLEVRVCDGENGSGVNLEACEVQFRREDLPINLTVSPPFYENETCGILSVELAGGPLAADGSGDDDGVYTLTVTSYDRAGNSATEEFSFRYRTVTDNGVPSIVSVSVLNPAYELLSQRTGPFDLGSVSESVATVLAAISDPAPSSGISASQSYIQLRGPGGVDVPGVSSLETQGLVFTLNVPLAVDGSDDGSYIATISVVDNEGNSTGGVATFFLSTFIPEPQAPIIVSVTPEDGAILNDILTEVCAVLQDRSGAGINFEQSSIDLDVPSGAPALSRGYQDYDEATNTICWKFNQSLATDGRSDGEYEITVRAYDNEGRQSERFRSSFVYDTRPPVVASVNAGSTPWVAPNYISISGLTAAGINIPLNRVDVKLEDRPVHGEVPAGVDVNNSKADITGPNGALSTIQTNNGIDTLVLEFGRLARDGEDDGVYQIDVTAVDNIGNTNPFPSEPPYMFTFIYDTQPPELVCAFAMCDEDSFPEVEKAPGDVRKPTPVYGECAVKTPEEMYRVLNSIDRVQLRLSDPEVGVGVDLASTATALFVYGPRGQMAGTRKVEGDDTVVFIFSRPLSGTDSSDDGIYTVKTTAYDLIGNQQPIEFKFEYKATAPVLMDIMLVDVELAAGEEAFSLSGDENVKFQGAVARIRAIFEDRSGKGLDFSKSLISVQGPGTSPQDRLENNGTDTLEYVFNNPLANDGSDDGSYLVYIKAVDKDGNWVEYLRAFRLDTRAPEVKEVRAGTSLIFSSSGAATVSVINGSLSGVSAKLHDVTTEVDLFKSTISLKGPVSVSALQVNNGVDTIALQFLPLPANGTADGRYTISVDPRDVLDSRLPEPLTFGFVYDTTPPKLASTVPASGEVVSAPVKQVKVVLTDGAAGDTAGVNLNACTFQLKGPKGTVSGQLTREAPGTLIFVPGTPWAVDGKDDGTYTMTITAKDMVGNSSSTPITVSFSYVTRSPGIASTVPANGAQIMIPVSRVTATLIDNSGAGLNLRTSSVTLVGPDGQVVPGKHGSTGSDTVTYTLDNILATDRTGDGLYVLNIAAVDNTGLSASYQTTFLYDRTPPAVISTTPADGTIAGGSLSSITVQLEDSGSGIDLEGSRVSLSAPGGTITASQVNDGVNTIRLEFQPLTEDGKYTISVLPADKVGNKASVAKTYSFILDTKPPVVVSTEPANGATVITALSRISASLDDSGGSGVSLSASEIHLYDPSGDEVYGVKTDNGVSRLVLTFPGLAVNGSEDGIYKITVIPRDKAGNTGSVSVNFEYKTLDPELVNVEIVSKDAVLSLKDEETQRFEKSITRVRVTLKDKSGSGLDFDFTDVNIDGPGASDLDTIDNNGKDIVTYYFAEPLANDGSDDGLYLIKIRAVDNDGHLAEYLASFIFDSTPPEIVSTIPADSSVLSESISAVYVTLSDALTEIDLFESEVKLSGPASLVTEQVNNGVDTIALRFFGLADDGTMDGLYKISVNPQDILGNNLPEPRIFTFVYDTTPPKVASMEPANGGMVTIPIERVIVVLTDGAADGTAGVDLAACSMELIGPDGKSVNGELIREGTDTLNFVLAATAGGPADGDYTVNVMTQDLAGNASAAPIKLSFTHVTKSPAISSTTPANGARFRTPVSYVAATLVDNSHAGLDLGKSSIKLIAPDGKVVPGTLTSVEPNVVRYDLGRRLSTDGNDDGVYTLDIVVADMTGDSASYRTTFVYDTTPPVVISTSPVNGSVMSGGMEFVSVKLDDAGAGVDLAGSKVALIGPSGDIKGSQVNNGVDTIEYRFTPLTSGGAADGRYVINVAPVDNVGNVPPEAKTFSFIYDTVAPAITKTEPIDGSTIVVALDRVSVQVDDAKGAGLDSKASFIQLRGPGGREIPGVREDSANAIILAFPALAVDGSANGQYSVTVTVQDLVGNVGKKYSFSFTYLPTAPGVITLTPADGSFTAEPVKRVVATLKDKSGSGINFGNSWLKLLSPNGQEVPGEMSNDGIASMILDLHTQFSTDGAADGKYTIEINAVDNQGNAALTTAGFVYDTTPCTVSRVYVGDAENGVTLDPDGIIPSDFGAIDRISAVLDDAGAGVDLSLSEMHLVNPFNAPINAKQQNDGSNTISLYFEPLSLLDGTYHVLLIPVDKLGNVSPQEKLYSFIVDTVPPKISASTPKLGATVVNTKLDVISIQLDDGEGTGIDSETPEVQVFGPNGEVAGKLEVQCKQDNPAVCTLLYTFDTPLAMDASDDGDYSVKVWFADNAKNGNITPDGLSEPAVVYFTYDTVQPGGPIINNVGVFPRAFSPNGDGTYETTTISYVLSKDASVKLLVYDSSRMLATALLDMEPRTAGMNSIVWNGTVSGSPGDPLLPDGTYLIKIDAVDDRGLTGAIESTSVVIDTQPPSVDRPVVSNNPFTPDGDGFADAADISFVVNGSEPNDRVTVEIYDQSLEKVSSPTLTRSFAGDGEYTAVWNGDGAREDGEYSFIITVQDVAGNLREVSGSVAMDRDGPVITVSSPVSHVLHTNQSPIVLSGKAVDWSGVRSVSMVGLFTPAGSDKPVTEPAISNWVKMTSSGDEIDNDADGSVDEEEFNSKDDDGDGLVDEDLTAGDGKLVYWIHRLEPQSEGEYNVRLRASDPIDHVSTYPEALELVYDVTPPVHVSTVGQSSISSSVGDVRVRNESRVTITTTWDQPGYKVTVDFAKLDSTFKEPVAAVDRNNGAYVVEYPVSKDNTQSDGLKSIVITAVDAAGNKTVVDTFSVRLRNDLPAVISHYSPDGRTSYADGSTVRILVECDIADLQVSADFSQLDSTYAPGKVRVTNNRDNTYLVEYTIGKENTLPDKPNIPIPIVASDGVESVSVEHIVSLDNTAPSIQSVRVKKDDSWFESVSSGDSVFLVNAAFANGNTVVIETVWDGAGYDLSADFSEMDSTYKPGAESVEAPEAGSSFYIYRVSYKLGSDNKMADGEDLAVVMTAVDAAGNKSKYVYIRLDLDNTAPEILSVTSADKDKVYKNGDTVGLIVKLDAKGYKVSGDFSALDSTYPARSNEVYVTDNGDGTYTVKYGISKDNTLGVDKVLTNIRITITVTDAVGNSSSDSSMMVTLDNIPPELEIESPESDALVFEARIEVKGRTERDATVRVTPKGVLNVTPDVPVDNNGSFSCPVALSIGYNTVTVTASDLAENVTTRKLTILYKPLIKAAEGGTVYLPEKTDDGISNNDTRVTVPAGAAKRDFTVEIVQLESPPPAVGNPAIGIGIIPPLVAYEFTVKDESGDHEISIAFVKPILLSLQYQGLKTLDVPAIICRWDGVRWNRIGGKEDRENNVVEATVNSMSIFGVFRGTEVTEFSLRGAFPNPFTPNNDGVNDMVSFYLDNPNNAETVIRIFDLRGALVRKLGDGLTSWDGLDDAVQPAEMGVYIYQIELDGKVKGGTIVLAK